MSNADAHSFNALILKILKGKYARPDKDYSQDLHSMIEQLLVSNEEERPDVNDILRMEACHKRILKCGIDIDILQNEFAHTALHGFKPLDILNADIDLKAAKTPGNLCLPVVRFCVCGGVCVCARGHTITHDHTGPGVRVHVTEATEVTLEGFLGQIVTRFVGAVGENMSKLYDACEDVQNDDELQVFPLPGPPTVSLCLYSTLLTDHCYAPASSLVLPLTFNPTPTPSLFQRAEAWDRDGQNIMDLQNGGSKFLLNGQTLELSGITPTDSRQARIEALRIYLEKQLGP